MLYCYDREDSGEEYPDTLDTSSEQAQAEEDANRQNERLVNAEIQEMNAQYTVNGPPKQGSQVPNTSEHHLYEAYLGRPAASRRSVEELSS